MDQRTDINGAVLTSPIVRLAIVMIVGITAGAWLEMLWLWLALALGCVVLMGVMHRRCRWRGVRCWGLLAFMALSAAWCVVRADYVDARGVERYIGAESQLAEVTGVVADEPRLISPDKGPFGRFSYQTPGTRFLLDVQTIVIDDQPWPATGRLWVKIDEADLRVRKGQSIRATGWLATFSEPMNPGEFDYRAFMRDRGVAGRLTLKTTGNWTLLEPPPEVRFLSLRALREKIASSALASLRLGMTEHPRALTLLETLLLGRRDSADRDMTESFRRVGLAHILSISGAHLGILLGIVWLIARLFVPSPPRVALIVMIVLGLYLLAVPLRVPILRAAIMAAMFCAGYASGRRVTSVDMLALAAIVVLLWRPTELFMPGFQLSFVAVAALLLFTGRVSEWLWPRSPFEAHYTAGRLAARWLVDYLAVSIVAFLAVLPLVAYHFGLVSPLAVLMSVLALPVLAAVLAVGYFKILIGLVLPSVSIVLAGPLAWFADMMLGLVDHAQRWPGVAVELSRPPGPMWTVATMALVIALLSGWFARRRAALAMSLALVIGWAVLADPAVGWNTKRPAVSLNMLAVGDGACYLVRLGDGHVLLFDCGSQAYLDVGRQSITPALRHLGVRRIDTLILSHADLDHYVGALDVAERFAVRRVLVPPQLLIEARSDPAGPTAFLVDELARHGLTPAPVTRGWREAHGGAELALLWPPGDLVTRRANDTSLVLSIRAAGRRVLLNGDIQQEAIAALLNGADLSADATDLPHHGSFVDDSPAWLDAVGPSIVLQSSGPARLRRDRWAPTLAGTDIQRFITAERGMVELTIDDRGRITVKGLNHRDNGPR